MNLSYAPPNRQKKKKFKKKIIISTFNNNVQRYIVLNTEHFLDILTILTNSE